MNPKMQRFLTSLKLENVERFDLEFDLCSRNALDPETIDMLVVKNTPWEYSLLEEFQNGLETIRYPYTISFSYRQKPTVYEAIKLFDDWHRSHYRYPNDLKLSCDKDTIIFSFESEKQKEEKEIVLKEYKEFLEFLNYRFQIEQVINEPVKEAIKISEKEMAKIEKAALKSAEKSLNEDPVENEASYYQDSGEIRENQAKEELKQFEEQYIKEMRENLKKLNAEKKLSKGRSSWRDNLPYKFVENFDEITAETGNVDISGELFGIDSPKVIRGNKLLLTMGLGNNGSAISVKAIENEYMSKEDIAKLKNGMFVRIRGYAEADRYTGQIVINARGYEFLPTPELRKDNAENKRVELHLHTKMSNMDGVSTITQYAELASHMGHKAIAITDHGVAQGFPEAQAASKKFNIKMLYGSELYMVNDNLPFALNPKDIRLQGAKYVVFDLETTGLSARYDRITEFGAVRFEGGRVVESIDFFVNPEMPVPEKIIQKTKITNEMVKNQPTIKEQLPKILEFFGDAIIVSHNINFDLGFINEALRREGKPELTNPAIDTLSLSRYMFPEARMHNLGSLSRNLGLSIYNDDDAHRADYDARVLNDVWLAMLNRLLADNYDLNHLDLAKFKVTTLMYKHMRPSHVVALAKNKKGLHDLYKLISDSHVTYFADVPKTPKTELLENRENLLIGSACFNGDVFDTARTRSKETLKNVVSFYDYIEVQPPENYSHLINNGNVSDYDEIKKYIKDIIEAADELNIPVVATGDAHYCNPEDKIIRDVYISAKGVGAKLHPLFLRHSAQAPDQHFRSTEEMLLAFDFLGKEKAEEIVVTNTNKIADMIEPIVPIDNVLRPPVIEESPKILRDICEKKAKDLYGDPLPPFIQDRLERELTPIIGNGYSVTYYIARRIVEEAHSHGYIVGSRGSVGSSFAAHLFGITEVNPLPPHYRCPKCKHLEFVDDPNILSGYDLPEKVCPICGESMLHDGQNIPFETFLGFTGEKVPDIDLNFPRDYQQSAFDYTKVVFGEHNVFRAGTIETVADKTAFGYVRGYYEDKFMKENRVTKEEASEAVSKISNQKIAYLASKCVEVKRTTGQHPGGIVVLPKGMSIYDFTPIQHPADDPESTWLTTHLDYNALHETLLKLDLLGHLDPMALRQMSDITGIDYKTIPLNDAKVISLFSTDKALNRNGNYLHAITGAAGLPEFGTDTGNDILLDAKPKSFADLVIIAGLAHGTDVWAHNAQDLIRSGTCTIRDVIGCRDDIMTYLIKKGLDNSVAFKIMEDVRKGKRLKPEYEKAMLANNVPQWYVDSCNKIKYMFPKAHAVAYVTMAVRVGYFKVYYPLEFYAIWFSVRCKAFDINAMLSGLDGVIAKYEEIKRKKNNRTEKISPKDKDLFSMLKIAIEMFERGYKFTNIDLYKSKGTEFVVDHENKALIPPFIVLDGLGDAAALSVEEARKDGKFLTKEDLIARTKLNSTNVEQLSNLGVLDGLSDTAQMSLFEFGLDDVDN